MKISWSSDSPPPFFGENKMPTALVRISIPVIAFSLTPIHEVLH